MKMKIVLFIASVVLFLAGCGGGGGSQKPTLQVNPNRLEITPLGQKTLEVTLKGISGQVEWSAEEGTIKGQGYKVTYIAPGYPADDTITVRSVQNPKVKATVPVLVRSSDYFNPRLSIDGDITLIFTQVGEEKELRVKVLNAWGEEIKDADVEFVSSDPAKFSIKKAGPRLAKIKALTGDIVSVRIVARYKGSEVYANALFAELKENAHYVSGKNVIDAKWDQKRMEWTEVTLSRNAQTESLKAGDVFFTGDRTGVWGEIISVNIQGDRVILKTRFASLPQIFKRLKLNYKGPTATVKISYFPKRNKGLLSVQSGQGGYVYSKEVECRSESPFDIEIREPRIDKVFNLTPDVGVDIDFPFDLEFARFVLNVEAGLEADSGSIRFSVNRATVTCALFKEDINLPVVSIGIASLTMSLHPELGVYTSLDAGGVGFTLEGPAARAVIIGRLGFEYPNDSIGWRFVNDWDRNFELRRPSFNTNLDFNITAEIGPYALVELGIGIIAHAVIKDITLIEGRFFKFRGDLPFWVQKGLPLDTSLASYEGPSWGMGYRLKGNLKLEFSGALADLLTSIFGSGAADLGEYELFTLEDRRAFLASPTVGVSATLSGGLWHVVDNTNSAVEFSFFPLDEDGTAEIWIEQGAGTDDSCFTGNLTKLGETSLPGTLSWTPNKTDRGIYRVYGRHYIDVISDIMPYGGPGYMRIVAVLGPDLSPPSPDYRILLKGKASSTRPATGIFQIYNRSHKLPAPSGCSQAELTLPLSWSVSVSEPDVTLDTSSGTTHAGGFSYVELSYDCSTQPAGYSQTATLTLSTNDQNFPTVDVPVDILCTDNEPPVATVRKTVPAFDTTTNTVTITAGDTLTIIGEPSDPNGGPMGCFIDPGDGSPIYEEPFPNCPRAPHITFGATHTYTTPGTYTASFVVIDEDGMRDSFNITVEVLEP